MTITTRSGLSVPVIYFALRLVHVAEGQDPGELAWLAKLERGEALARYVAEAGVRYEPNNPFWRRLLDLLPPGVPAKSGVVPHPTRFVAMSGFTRRGPENVVEWIRP